jgi:hypothetical protein
VAGRGSAWEFQLERWAKMYWAAREAFVWHNHPQFKRMGDGQWRPTGLGMVDYSGVLAGGKALAFDAKQCNTASLALSQIAPHQMVALRQVHEMGGLAFIAARLSRTGACVVFPWSTIAATTERKSLRPEDGIPMNEHGWLTWAKEQT